jgi:hypothetical protein
LKAIDPRKAILRKAAANLQTDERLLCGKTGSEDLVEKGRAKRLSEYRDVVRSKAPWAPALACRLKDREQDAAIRRLAAIDCESAR